MLLRGKLEKMEDYWFWAEVICLPERLVLGSITFLEVWWINTWNCIHRNLFVISSEEALKQEIGSGSYSRSYLTLKDSKWNCQTIPPSIPVLSTLTGNDSLGSWAETSPSNCYKEPFLMAEGLHQKPSVCILKVSYGTPCKLSLQEDMHNPCSESIGA